MKWIRASSSRYTQRNTEVSGPALERLPLGQRAFKGTDPRGRPPVLAAATTDPLDTYWRRASSYDRRAVITSAEPLTTTGTVKVTLRVIDGRPFTFDPGQFIGVEADVAGARRRRTPYCILSAPDGGHTFSILVRVVPDGPLSQYLTGLRPGDEIGFRGPTGRSMIPKEEDTEVILLATGVGISPLYSLARHLLTTGTERPVRLLWGLRLAEDICLRAELDELAEQHRNFSYQISLSQPNAAWTGPRGRLTDTAPPELGTLEAKHFYLCGNGAMIAEISTALAEAGVNETLIYQEAFFNGRYKPDPAMVTALRDRLVADRALSPVLTGNPTLFVLERPIYAPDARAPQRPLVVAAAHRAS